MKSRPDKNQLDYISSLVDQGFTRAEIRHILTKELGCGKTKAYDLIDQANKANPSVRVTTSLKEVENKYTYNQQLDTYVIYTKTAPDSNLVVAGAVIRGIQADYTAGKLSLTQLAVKQGWSRPMAVDVLKKLGITHDSLPVTDEEIDKQPVADSVKNILQLKKFDVQQRVEREHWKETQGDAEKWQAYQQNRLDPFKVFLDNWTPPAYKPVTFAALNGNDGNSKRVFVAGAFDWHVGALAETRYIPGLEADWNIEAAQRAVANYTLKVAQYVEKDYEGFDRAVLLLGGDLYHSLFGYTEKGTQLISDKIKDTQFDAVFSCLTFFINRMIEIFGKVEVRYVRGNHGSTTDYALGVALKSYFRTEERVEIHIYSSRHAVFKVNNTVLVLEHGAAGEVKHLVPKDGAGRDAYVQKILLDNANLVVGSNQCLFVMGDQHHYKQHDTGSYEFIQMGALPLGDQYAAALGLKSRARQNCLIISDDGLDAVLHIYTK